MKKMLIFLTALAMIAGFSTMSFATVVGSDHDLSDNFAGQDQVCIFCHTPHNAQAPGPDGVLWNRTAPVGNGTFTLYSGAENQDATGISAQCLSCHDGVTNLDAFGGGTGTAISAMSDIFPASPADLGSDLSNDHPVMVAYTGGGEFQATPTAGAEIFDGMVECASCHNPHEQTFVADGYFLRGTNAGSALCLGCHIK